EGGSEPIEAKCQIENVPLQAWTNLIMVLNGQALDCYLDGKLVRTCLMPGVPKVAAAGDLILTPGGNSFQGYTGNFQYFNRAVNPREAYAIYREGLVFPFLSTLTVILNVLISGLYQNVGLPA
ncbi:unnamed protein product, partial [marine sediment metagenome]